MTESTSFEPLYDEKALNQRPYGFSQPDHIVLFNKWIERGDMVLVYENAEIGNPNLGGLIAMPCDVAQRPAVKLGDRAPDSKAGMGWRYRLIACTRNPEDFKVGSR